MKRLETENIQQIKPAFVAPGWPPAAFPNGIVTYVEHMRRGMHDLGVAPLVLTGKLRDAAGEEDVLPFRTLENESLKDRFANRLRWLCSRRLYHEHRFSNAVLPLITGSADCRGADILEVEESRGIARGLVKKSPVPIVVRLHGPCFLSGAVKGVPRDKRFKRRDSSEGGFIRSAHAISAPSRDVLSRTREHFGLSHSRGIVIPNPCASVPECRRWRGASATETAVLFVGRFDLTKGGDIAIQAFKKVLKLHSRAILWFVGPDCGIQMHENEVQTLGRYISRHLPDGSYRCFGVLSAGEIEKLRARAAVVLVSSRYETFGYTVTEAMAMGCPLVAARAGGIPEIVDDGESGLLCEPENASDMAEKISLLLHNSELASRLGARAAEVIEERYSPKEVARQTLEFYQEVLERWHSHRGRRVTR